ncbi:MAG TPA: hypothetical protein VLM42_12990 [Bryobacteraceae bacterium]|nr:hypothetical protein [Bryobacteraceae bacterium]
MWGSCAVLFMLLTANLWAVDLPSIQQEPNPERRSQLAMDYAGAALDAARSAYQSSDLEKTQTSLTEVGAAVDLAYGSLQQSGKEARRDPKFFKRAELSTRQLLRRIEGFAESMSFEDRAAAEKLRDRVAAIHDNLLQDLMAKKKK